MAGDGPPMTFRADVLENSGDVGRDLAAVDWAQTSIGDPETWPASLRSAIQILLTSRFSMWMAWGPELTFFCNDAYRRDTLANKYPWALGRPASEVWAEIWDDIGPRIEHVLRTGEATWDESLLLFLERSGYVEETYHTFSYSPLSDDHGVISGMLCVVKEDTAQVIANRRMRTVRDLGVRATGLEEGGAIRAACQRLAGDPKSLPFTLVYVFDHATRLAQLAGTSGIRPGHRAAPSKIDVDDPVAVWPAARALAGEVTRIDGLRERFTSLPTGAWHDPPDQAFVVPLMQPAQPLPYGFLVASINPYRRADEAFEGFVTLLSTQLAAIISDARAYELERQRAETLAALDQAKTDFFTSVSHEFRTPLTLLLGPAEEALADGDDPLNPTHQARMEVIHRNGLRLLKLVNSLLDFSRLESSGAQAHFEPVDLARYTTELASMFDSAAERGGLSLEIDCPPLADSVYVDQERWAKIVLNLVSNALKFTFEGSIGVRLRADGDHAVLTVSDTGTGIPADQMPHLFERFHRVRGATGRAHEGSGIGLALVHELTAVHGGQVSAESEPGVGTTFTVRIPLGSAHLPAEQVSPAGQVDPLIHAQGYVSEALRWVTNPSDDPADATAGDVPSTHDLPHVLVVDDNDDMREYVAGLLRSSYRVTTAVDGLDALARIEQSLPDLVVTDVMMPNLDGFGLLQRLQSQPATTGVPTIMLSARAGDDGVIEGLEAGADDYLVKPFSARELLARVAANLELDRAQRVRRTLERSQALLDQAQRLAKVGSWEIDVDADRLRGSEEFYRILGLTAAEVAARGYRGVLADLVHADDAEEVSRTFAETLDEAVDDAVTHGIARIRTPAGEEKVLESWVEVAADDEGRRVLRGSVQDVTAQRELERSLSASLAKEQAAAREHAIAEYLQRSLLPERTYDLEQLDVATYYRAGVEGTQVGGDWYDVIELGAGRVALVVGDVMGRGVRAASVMGQMRSAVRTLAKLDLSPGEVIEQLDGFVADLESYQMVTCVFAVFDSTDQTLCYANAGHVPPFLYTPSGGTAWLDANAPPLGAGSYATPSVELRLEPEARVVFYTDGLVEVRGQSLDVGIQALEDQLAQHADLPVEDVPEALVRALRPEGPDDDVALLVIRVNGEPFRSAVSHRLATGESAVAETRKMVVDQLREWGLQESLVEDIALTTHELVANALVHGVPPVDLRLVLTGSQLVVEVHDRSTDRPRRHLVETGEEHGRGLQLVSALADDWGARVGSGSKTVWASHSLTPAGR
jgi:PAS domain S-box-containing protein